MCFNPAAIRVSRLSNVPAQSAFGHVESFCLVIVGLPRPSTS